MNYYPYNAKVVNENEVNDFFNKDSFVGYILPDGEIYSCENHNVASLQSFYDMMVELLKNNYTHKDEFLGRETKDPLFLMVADFLYNNRLEDIIKFDNFIHQNNLSISDILVSFFGCHLVTRLNKRILTSSILHYPFYNYILMGFKIDTIPKIIYKDNAFCFHEGSFYNNDFLMDEIEEINGEITEEEKPLFMR